MRKVLKAGKGKVCHCLSAGREWGWGATCNLPWSSAMGLPKGSPLGPQESGTLTICEGGGTQIWGEGLL